MRRTTPGAVGADELIDARIAHADRYSPETVVRILEPLVTQERRTRLHQVISQRIMKVAVVFDGPYDPHNGAAVLRSCEAFGVQQLRVVERPGTPFVVARSVARSAEKWLDVTCHDGVDSLVSWARSTDMALVEAHPEGELTPDRLAALPRVAIVVGNEREGIRPALSAACSARVRVPMRGFVESLNVSVTAAILLYAATRGREGDLDEDQRARLYARGLLLTVPHALDILDSAP